MADRQCTLCGEFYTDEKRHDYDVCVARCKGILEQAKIDAHKSLDRLNDAHDHYHEAIRISKLDWRTWEKKPLPHKLKV